MYLRCIVLLHGPANLLASVKYIRGGRATVTVSLRTGILLLMSVLVSRRKIEIHLTFNLQTFKFFLGRIIYLVDDHLLFRPYTQTQHNQFGTEIVSPGLLPNAVSSQSIISGSFTLARVRVLKQTIIVASNLGNLATS